ncbi:MAG: hypothetical protein HYV90_01205 [Candidatus Woesebacteria bacterium]|nr:MAG: hypothetical protein HYV90_01205 [Candidatus Woesebacteria bacterium]
MSDKKVKQNFVRFIIYSLLLLVLFLSAFDISVFLRLKTKVLGVSTPGDEQSFWTDFTSNHPNYIPGWIELGRMDKVKEIDPNFKLDTSY